MNNYVPRTDLTNTLNNYVTNSNLTTQLGNYVTSANLINQLKNYVTSTTFTNEFKKYTTTTDLNNKLSGYVTLSGLDQAISDKINSVGLAKIYTQIAPDWTKILNLTAAGNYTIKTNCWVLPSSDMNYNVMATVQVNGYTISSGTNINLQWNYQNFNFVPLVPNDKVTLSGSNTARLFPCKYVGKAAEATKITVAVAKESKNPLEELLIKDYYPLTDEQIKQIEEEMKELLEL